ncbi:MAG: VCBS repeat-containing protein [Pseudomonadota bacterium]
MTLALRTPFKSKPCKQAFWINFLLVSFVVSHAGFALAQTATRQDQLLKEAYRLTIPSDILTYPWMSSIVDYDNDGSLDVILYGHHSKDAYIWRGAQGEADYLPKGSWVFGVRDPIWLDVDKDGDIDGIGTEGTGISGKLFTNDGLGNFTQSKQPYWLPSNDLSDIAKVLPMPAHIQPAKHPLDAKLTKVHYVDLNNDGQPELVANVTGQITFQTESGPVKRYSGYSWVLEQHAGVWVDVTETLGLREGPEQHLLPEDIDMDGDLDLIDLFAENLYRNDGYLFTKVNSAPIFGGRRPYDGDGEIDVFDLDNNGYRDLIFGGDHTSLYGTYLNTGDFSFQKLEGNIIRANRRTRKFADLDFDGDIDMVAYDGKQIIVYDNITTNRGIYITFEGDYFGTQLQVKNSSGKLVFNAQLFQLQTRGMSQVYTNKIHVGGITGPVEALVNKQAAIGYILDESVDPGIPSFVKGILHLPRVKVDGVVYAVNLQFTDPTTGTFSVRDIQYASSDEQADADLDTATYLNGVLTIPSLRTAGTKHYEARLDLVADSSPKKFVLTSSAEVP